MSTQTLSKKSWVVEMLSSSIGKKLLMSLTGIFLILFLTVHLIGNLQLLSPDNGESFNKYAHFMGHNPLIQTISIGNFIFILLHIVVAFVLTSYNTKARPVQYAYVKASTNSAWSSRNMIWLGSLVMIFLVIHLGQFWWRSKVGSLPIVQYADGHQIRDLYKVTREAFFQGWIVALYVVSMVGLSYHLLHGFQSAFQTLGLNHSKYNALIKLVGVVYAIFIPLGFAIIPLYMFFAQ